MPINNAMMDKGKAKSYQALIHAITDNNITYEDLGRKIGVHPNSLRQSVKRQTLRLESFYELEKALKCKLVYSQFDEVAEGGTLALKAKIETMENFIKQLLEKIPSSDTQQPPIKNKKK